MYPLLAAVSLKPKFDYISWAAQRYGTDAAVSLKPKFDYI